MDTISNSGTKKNDGEEKGKELSVNDGSFFCLVDKYFSDESKGVEFTYQAPVLFPISSGGLNQIEGSQR